MAGSGNGSVKIRKRELNSKSATILMIACAMMWGSSFVTSKMCMNGGMLPFETVFYRFVAGSIILLIVCRSHLKDFSRKALIAGVLVGLVNAVSYLFEMTALSLADASVVSFLESTGVVFVSIVSCIIFHHRFKLTNLIVVVLTVVGVYFVAPPTKGAFGMGRGELCALIVAMMGPFHVFVVYLTSADCDPIQISIAQFITTAVFMGVAALFQGHGAHYETSAYYALAYQIIFPTVLCFVIRNITIQYAAPMWSTLILSTETIWCAVYSVLLLKERLTLNIIIGAILICTAIFIEATHPTPTGNPAEKKVEKQNQ